jgi:tetratricopeptide (TPR) repeat protein
LHEDLLDFGPANDEYEKAAARAPGNAHVLAGAGRFAVWMGDSDSGLLRVHRAVTLDPINGTTHYRLGMALYYAHQYSDAIVSYGNAISLNSDDWDSRALQGLAYYSFGDLERARLSCEVYRNDFYSQMCLALTYKRLGRDQDAETEIKKIENQRGAAAAYWYASIYAQWGDKRRALSWLQTAMRLHDAVLTYLKTDPLMDPIRSEPRFQAIERALKFPD